MRAWMQTIFDETLSPLFTDQLKLLSRSAVQSLTSSRGGTVMRTPEFTDWFTCLESLSEAQREQVLAALHPAAGLDRIVALITEIRAPIRRCPRCTSPHCHRNGHASNLPRYRCCQCGRTFNDLTGTPLAHLRHKGKWLDYLATVLDSRPVRAAATRVGVHRNTAFRWRHRFLHWVKYDRAPKLTGIVEADEMFILESHKGSRHLDRAPRRRGGHASKPGISKDLDCILVARNRDGQTHGIAHQTVNLRAGVRVRASVRGAIHVQNVNAYHRRFREWLAHFHGVASRYLPNYLGWCWALDGDRVATVEQLFRIAISLILKYR